MKSNIQDRLRHLEEQIKADGIVLVDAVPGGYLLPAGEFLKDLAPLHKKYSVIIIDDLAPEYEIQ